MLDPRAALEPTQASRPVMLVGFQRHSNLGLGYLASNLRRHGFRVQMLDVEAEPERLLQAARDLDPVLIGFSLIYQQYAAWFGSLMKYLRENGVTCHFTIGGHFPSLSYERTLEMLPDLDSVVRFEGEETLVELVDCLCRRSDWHVLPGVAYREGQAIVASPLRPLIRDLDELPYPERAFGKNMILGHETTSMLASRGCARTCSFCSIHKFYRTAPGRTVRTRKPADVVREMRMLLETHGVSIFMFQDDDFPVSGPRWRRWAAEFLNELHRNGLPGRAVWKISCRADGIERDLFAEMRAAGLYLVYLGLESGTSEGLKTLHKETTVAQNIRAVEILKDIDVLLRFGFMLVDPSSTFDSVRANLRFLRTIVEDGSGAATFGRMAPYDGTPIRDELERAGRLRGDVNRPDYAFLDPRLTDFCNALGHIFEMTGWVHGDRTLAKQLNFALGEVAVIERLFPAVPELPAYKEALRATTRESNEALFDVIEDLSYTFSDGRPATWSVEDLRSRCVALLDRMVSRRNAFVLRNEARLLAALEQQPHAGQ